VVLDGKLKIVWRSEVGQYCDDEFWAALRLWDMWKTFGGFPFAGNAWGDEQARIVETVYAVEGAMNASR
jgi:hypothetical protein